MYPRDPARTTRSGAPRDEYRRDFFAAMRGRTVTNVLSEGVDADGGYLVPTEFERTIVQGLDEDNVIRKLAKTITTSVERKVPIAATPSVATWVAENGAIPESGVTFDQKTLDAYKLTDLVKVSVELLADSMFDLEPTSPLSLREPWAWLRRKLSASATAPAVPPASSPRTAVMWAPLPAVRRSPLMM